MMGLAYLHGQLQLLQDTIRQERIVLSGLRIAELGNQFFRESVLGAEVPAKKVFEALGATHTSFDINGKNGAVALDLSRPLPGDQQRGAYDLVTNFGTSEHVADSQYQCWRNIHDLCAPGGLMLHAIPEVGSWPRHGMWHYTLPRVLAVAAAARYKLRITHVHEYTHTDGRKQNSLQLCFQKDGDQFPDEPTFQSIMFPEGEEWY